jgi:hypothetical protein
MDSYRDHPSDFGQSTPEEAPAPNPVAMEIGNDERRMHVRAYNYWVSLLDGRDFPSIEDLEPGEVSDFAENSVLLDFTCGRDNPAIPYVGNAIREECALDDNMRTISDVPSRSLLSRLTDHYMQIIANRAPVGFEAEFENPYAESICYRGILMPFSSDGDAIDFIYGVINWKRVDAPSVAAPLYAPSSEPDPAPVEIAGIADTEFEADPTPTAVDDDAPTGPEFAEEEEEPFELTELAPQEGEEPLELTEPAVVEAEEPLELTELAEPEPADEYVAEPEFAPEPEAPEAEYEPEASFQPVEFEQPEPAPFETQGEPAAEAPPHFSWEDGPLHDEDDVALPEFALDANAGLADRLWAARETAESVKAGEGRTRSALYKALSLAYDFAVGAQESPDEYAELLEESGVKAQARAPMTPIVKLVFGIDYDKARLTEFAAALSFAQRQDIAVGAFQDFIEKQPGGLKALVAAERQARRPEARGDTKGEVARARLRNAPTISLAEVPADEEFAVVVTRRGADGTHEPVAIVADEALVERAIRRTL